MAVWTALRLKTVADECVTDALHRESPPHVNELAAKLAFSRGDFSRLFRQLVGEHPSAYLRRGQITCAKRLLTQTEAPMNVIAYQCGFGTRTTFFRWFKRETGVTPGEYRATYT